MLKPLVLAHVSDFHVSTFGDSWHDRAGMVKRSARLADVSPLRFEAVWSNAGWSALRTRDTSRAVRHVLVDPDGYAHALFRDGARPDDPVAQAVTKATGLDARRARTLADHPPSDSTLRELLEATPRNTNLRLLRAARAVEAEGDVDVVVATGDLTDDGDGWSLVQSAFARWAAAGRLLVVPGNHDLYLFPLAGSARPRPTHASKRSAWRTFARGLGLSLDASGAWAKAFPESGCMFVGLDTCAAPQRRFFRHNGAVGPAQAEALRRIAATPEWMTARHRVVALHHHVVPLATGVGRRAPTEIGMRLDDARATAALLDEVGATLVLHGHRHVSEERRPAGCHFRLLAAPSLTLGCKSGDGPSFWKLELGERTHVSRVHIPIHAVPHAESADSGSSVQDAEQDAEQDEHH